MSSNVRRRRAQSPRNRQTEHVAIGLLAFQVAALLVLTLR